MGYLAQLLDTFEKRTLALEGLNWVSNFAKKCAIGLYAKSHGESPLTMKNAVPFCVKGPKAGQNLIDIKTEK